MGKKGVRPAAQNPCQGPTPTAAEFLRIARRHFTAAELAAMDRAIWRRVVQEFVAERERRAAPEQLSGGNK